MSYFLAILVSLRLIMWRVFPQYGTGIVSDSIFCMLAFTVFILYTINKRYTRFTPWLFLWIIATTLSVFNSPRLAVSFTAWFILLVNVLMFHLTIRHLRDQNSISVLWTVMMLGAVIAAAIGIREFFLLRFYPTPTNLESVALGIYTTRRSCSFLGWPTIFAGYLVLFLPSVWFEARYSFKQMKVFWAVCLVIMLLGLVSAFSVLAPLSLLIAIIISGSTKRLKWVLVAVGVIILFAGSTKSITTFVEARQEYYQAAWQMIVQHPYVGQGIGTFQSTGPAKSVFAHNSYLQIWAETGLLGFIGVLGVVYTFWNMKPKTNYEKGMYIGLLAFFIDNLFSFSLVKPNLSFAGWLALACYIAHFKLRTKRGI